MKDALRNTFAMQSVVLPLAFVLAIPFASTSLGSGEAARGSPAGEPGATAIYRASAAGDGKALEGLIAEGGDVNRRNNDGIAALHIAAFQGHGNALRTLIDAGADANAHADGGRTPLHLAAVNGYERALRILIDAGADMEAPTRRGVTALHLAARSSRPEAVRVLLGAGANPRAIAPSVVRHRHHLRVIGLVRSPMVAKSGRSSSAPCASEKTTVPSPNNAAKASVRTTAMALECRVTITPWS